MGVLGGRLRTSVEWDDLVREGASLAIHIRRLCTRSCSTLAMGASFELGKRRLLRQSRVAEVQSWASFELGIRGSVLRLPSSALLCEADSVEAVAVEEVGGSLFAA